jgi:hypothetical protein
MEKKNLKNKGYENCSTEHKLILTHFGENFVFFGIYYPSLKQFSTFSTEACHKGRRSGLLALFIHINPFDYLKCGVSRRGINRSSHIKKQS